MLKNKYFGGKGKSSPLQMNILVNLKYQPLTLRELSERLDRRKSNVSQAVRSLIKKGYAKRIGMEYNRKHKITPLGLDVLKEVKTVGLKSLLDKNVPKREYRCAHYHACMRILTVTNKDSPHCETCELCILLPKEVYRNG